MTIIVSGRLVEAEAEARNQTAVALPSDGTQLGILGGVQAGLTLTKTSGMGWSLDLGRAVIAPATAATGPVVATVTVAEVGSFANGDATRDRIDVVSLQIDETATTANGNPRVKTVVIQGAYPVSGNPVTPTIPAGSIGLASVKIAAGTSAAGGGWNTANLIDIGPNLGRLHAEFTSSPNNVPNGSPWGVGLVTADPVTTENNTFCAPGLQDYVNILQDGIYNVSSVHVPNTAPGTNPSFVIIRKGAAGQVYATGLTFQSGPYEISASAAGISLKAGDTLRFYCINNSGATQTWVNRIFITKLQ